MLDSIRKLFPDFLGHLHEVIVPPGCGYINFVVLLGGQLLSYEVIKGCCNCFIQNSLEYSDFKFIFLIGILIFDNFLGVTFILATPKK